MRTFKELRRDLDLSTIGFFLYICGALNTKKLKIRALHPIGLVVWVIAVLIVLPYNCLFSTITVQELFEPITWW